MADSLRRTPLYDSHAALGARLVPFAGYEMPVQYEGIVKEHQAVRERVGLFDVSHMGELILEGPEALEVANGLITNAAGDLPVGKALYTVCCNEQGAILDDLIVYRRGEERVLIVCNASNVAKISAHVGAACEGRCTFRDESDATALLALQGPKAVDVMAALGATFATELGFFHLAEGEVGSIPCTLARTGYTGEDGFELFCANEHAADLWAKLMEAGAAFGIAPAGLGCRDTLRLEAKLALYGNDIDETTHPFEAGLGWVVKLDARGPSSAGRRSGSHQGRGSSARKLVGFEMTGRGIARHGYPILDPDSGEAHRRRSPVARRGRRLDGTSVSAMCPKALSQALGTRAGHRDPWQAGRGGRGSDHARFTSAIGEQLAWPDSTRGTFSYTREHEWARKRKARSFASGITAYAVEQLGDVTLDRATCAGANRRSGARAFGGHRVGEGRQRAVRAR